MIRVSLERWGRNAAARLIGWVFPIRKVSPESVRAALARGQIHKVLLVRPHQGLGDLLLATPIFRALQEAAPSVALHFLASDYNAVAVQHNPHLDKLWVWEKKKPFRIGKWLRGLRAEKFDLALIISSHVPSFTSFALACLSGARIVWAFATPAHYDGANWSRWLAHVEIANPPPEEPEYVKFMSLVSPLLSMPLSRHSGESRNPVPLRVTPLDPGFRRGDGRATEQLCEGYDYTPEFFIGPEEKAWAQERWRSYRFPDNRAVIGLFLGGNPDRAERLWAAPSWADLARKLAARKDVSLMAVVPPDGAVSGSGVREPGVYEPVSDLLGVRLPVFSDPDLRKVAAFLRHLDLFICADGGLLHVAMASGVRTLGLFFGADARRWLPPVAWASALCPADRKSASLSPEDVFQKAQTLLSSPHVVSGDPSNKAVPKEKDGFPITTSGMTAGGKDFCL